MNLIFSLEMIGIAAFAVSGALAASRKRMDIFGFIVLAILTSTGGGTIRDMVLDRGPVFWVDDNSYLVVAIIAALIVYFAPQPKPGGRRRFLVWTDAMGLVLFAALGTEICLSAETSPLVAVILGVTTAVTGGMLRDIICNEIPLVLSREIYATAAFVASCGYVLGDSLGLPAYTSLAFGALAGFTLRALAIRFDWSLPSFGADRT